ncbi:Plasmodesmata-located protein 7 [Linum grandiflorum]
MATRRRRHPFLLLLLLISTTAAADDKKDSFLYGGCTQQKYTQLSPYESNLNSLLTSLVNSATYSSFNKFTILGSDVVYGLYQCRGDLSMPDCATCVAAAISRFSSLCPQAAGAAVQLQGCYAKYDNATFLGVQDKTVVLKKCGPSAGYDADAASLRDVVLSGLGARAGAYYRVGGSGRVQGLAQCLGDLSVGQCQDCLGEAIGRLKSECGNADFGDMFLAKCYVRYSSSGGARMGSNGNYGNNNYGYNSNKPSGKSTNEGEKTFAIIIGLLAGVALLIIFLTFVRKIACGGHGK